MKSNQVGYNGGAWSEETHMKLHPKNFNEGLADFIVTKIQPKSLLEFGSGIGYLSKYLTQYLSLQDTYCIEPNEITGVYDNITGPKLLSLNIFSDNHPHVLNKKFDLVMSIEVAEHIEREKHDVLFDFLVAHTSQWIIFSGARIGQGGHGHISERDEEDWKLEFLKRGMLFQDILTKNIRQACDKKNINHQQNLMIFKRSQDYIELDTIEEKAKPYLRDILAIIQQTSKSLIGNLFYVDLQDAINAMPIDNLKEKRRTLVSLVKNRKNILEIGFNAGHSALIMLLSNQNSKITIIDTCDPLYTVECFNYLKRLFPNRLKLIQGNSTKVINELENETFDLIHFDGGKEKTIYEDLQNTFNLVKQNHVLVIDDTQNKELQKIVLALEEKDFIELDTYRTLSKRTDSYKWKHAIATFPFYKNILVETILKKLQAVYNQNIFPSLYTNNKDINQIDGFSRASSLIDIIKTINYNKIQGDFVECGVAAGHSSIIAALTLIELDNKSVNLHLYDTYNGFNFPLPNEKDLKNKLIEEYDLQRYQSIHTSTTTVFEKFLEIGLQPARIKMIKGMVEDTIPRYLPKKINVLRLDMDLYQPTLHCLNEMYPLLEEGGYLIIDDYGHWEGCKKAVDEFFKENNLNINELIYVDYTCRVFKK